MKWELFFFLTTGGACLVALLVILQQQLSVERYLVADRGVSLYTGGISTGAGWIHAPAILVSGLFAYRGPWFFACFFIPNVLALVLQAWVAPRIRQKMREKGERWYTMAHAMGGIFGPRVRTMMFVATFLALALAVGYTFAAIRQWVEQLKDYEPHHIAIGIAIFSFVFVIFRGLPAAIMSDRLKMAIIGLSIVGTIALFFVVIGGGVTPVGPPLAANELGLQWYEVLWFVGLPFTASLLGGPMCNPDLPERLLAIQEKAVRLAYMQGAAYFALATLVFGTFGYLARDLGIVPKPGEVPMVSVLQVALPNWGLDIVTIAILAVLAMALASLLASAGDVISIEVVQRMFRKNASDRETIAWSRVSMLVVIVIGAYITSFKPINVAFLQESMAVVRGEAIFPVIFAAALVLSDRVDARYVFWGMLLGFVGGFLLYLGWFSMNAGLAKAFPTIAAIGGPIGRLPLIATHGKVFASLWAVLVPLGFCVLGVLSASKRDFLARYPS